MVLLKINKKKLIYILNIINLLVEKKSIDKKSENIFFIKKKNKIYFSITDTIILIKKKIKIKKIYSKKNILISFSIKTFIKIIQNFPNCNIKIIYKKKKIIIKKKYINYSFKVKEENNYYNKKDEKYDRKIIVNKKIFLELIDSVYFIINKNTNKKYSLLSIKNNCIEILSTDNYRSVFNKITIENQNIRKNLVLPNKILQILNKILKLNKEEKIIIKFNKFQIKFKLQNLEIISKIINNNYPILKDKIKKTYINNFIINKKELQLSLKRSNIITEKENFSKWIINKNNLKILTNWDSNKGKEIINIEYLGKNLNIGIDNNHILELILNTKSEILKFNFSKNKIIILNPEKKNFKYITTSIKM